MKMKKSNCLCASLIFGLLHFIMDLCIAINWVILTINNPGQIDKNFLAFILMAINMIFVILALKIIGRGMIVSTAKMQKRRQYFTSLL